MPLVSTILPKVIANISVFFQFNNILVSRNFTENILTDLADAKNMFATYCTCRFAFLSLLFSCVSLFSCASLFSFSLFRLSSLSFPSQCLLRTLLSKPPRTVNKIMRTSLDHKRSKVRLFSSSLGLCRRRTSHHKRGGTAARQRSNSTPVGATPRSRSLPLHTVRQEQSLQTTKWATRIALARDS